MATQYAPDVERPPTATDPRRSGGLWRRLLARIGLGGWEDRLLLENSTEVAWRVYQDYHQLAIVDPGEQREFRIVKKGQLNMRPYDDGQEVDYLVVQLSERVRRVRIYRRRLAEDVEVYDLRVA